MPDQKKKKHFLKVPKYQGGNQAFNEFISKNLNYPAAALEGRIEGPVIVEYDITDDGFVHNPRILKGLGYGCDEEALRVVSLLRFEKVKNRGIRVRITKKTRINFRLPVTRVITYSVSKKNEQEKQRKKENPVKYNYTLNFQRN